MGWIIAGRPAVAIGCVVLLQLAGAAFAGTPTVQELLAEEDRTFVNQAVDWDRQVLALPADLVLEPSVRDAATAMLQAHGARVRELVPAWIAQERALARMPALRGRALSQPIYQRMINEMALWAVESPEPGQDEAWLKAALSPTACRDVPPSVFAVHMALIQAAPAELRPALLASERQLMARWGTKRAAIPPRPSTDDLDAADQAIARLRSGLSIAAGPMTPYLAGQLFNRDRKPGKSDRWEQCAKSQWWLGFQVADPQADRALALTVYRYATMRDVREFLPPAARTASAGRLAQAGQPYPLEAAYFDVEGTTTVHVETDDSGKLVRSRVESRKLAVPGVRDNRPVAYETLLDAAALDVAAKRHYPDGKATRDSVEIAWHLK